MTNSNEQFKAGDEVYCPVKGFNIYVLERNCVKSHPLKISQTHGFTVEGLDIPSDKVSAIFHATPENKTLLEALYKCEFESPKLKGSDLTRKLLREGAKNILCYSSGNSDEAALNGKGI